MPLVVEEAALVPPAVVVHGGAGTYDRVTAGEAAARLEGGIADALRRGWDVLASGGSALDSAVAAVVALEGSGLFNAGRGAVPTTAGTVERDAAVMDGRTGAAGAVCATMTANPVRLAAAVAELRRADGHPILLAGAGADALGAELRLGAASQPSVDPLAPVSDTGTVGAVVVDADGHLAAATSTGGRRGQRPGRVGDSPILGAGTWADDRSVAVSATGAGEAFILAGFAHRVAWAVEAGEPSVDAVAGALAAANRWGGDGGAIAVRPDGLVVAAFDTPAMARGWRDASTTVVRVLDPG